MKARQGHHADARAAIAELRADFGDHRSIEVGVWLFIAESFVEHYSNLGEASRDRMKRALAVSTAAGLPRLRMLSATSMAHFEYYRDAPAEMAKYLAMAFADMQSADRVSLARAYLIGAMSYHFGGRFDLAQPWYLKAREHAMAAGDDVFIGALNGNIAALRAVQAQQAAALGVVDPDELARTLAFVNSAANFDRYVRTRAFSSLLPFVKAVIAGLQGNYVEAIALYEGVLDLLNDEGLADMRGAIFADMAWCFIRMGRQDEARQYAAKSISADHDSDHVEDRLVAHARLAQVFHELGEHVEAERFASTASETLEKHRLLQRQFVDEMDRIGIKP